MKVFSIYDSEFKPYGKIIENIDTSTILEALEKHTPLPEGVGYVPSEPALESLPIKEELKNRLFGGMPLEMGYCNGHNRKLNCLEYHRDSEFSTGSRDYILLLAKMDEIEEDGMLDTKNVKAFLVPKGVMVEVYATTLHFAPCENDSMEGFKVLIALPDGTNTDAPEFEKATREDKLLTAKNKWLLAHPESDEAKSGAVIGLKGDNITLS